MAKHLAGSINKNHVVSAETDGFNYKIDWLDMKEEGQAEGASPTGVLLASLAGCNLITAQSFLTKKRYEYARLDIEINGEFIKEDPYTRLKAEVVITTDAKLDEAALEKLEAFIDRHCTVSRVLASSNDITTKIELV